MCKRSPAESRSHKRCPASCRLHKQSPAVCRFLSRGHALRWFHIQGSARAGYPFVDLLVCGLPFGPYRALSGANHFLVGSVFHEVLHRSGFSFTFIHLLSSHLAHSIVDLAAPFAFSFVGIASCVSFQCPHQRARRLAPAPQRFLPGRFPTRRLSCLARPMSQRQEAKAMTSDFPALL